MKYIPYLVCFLLMTNVFAQRTNSADRPNIIIILADDAGYADFGFMGSADILTPHIDQLASDGVVFTDAHVSASVCSPSRAGLLTGKYQQRFGHECNLEPDQDGAFDSSEVTIAEALQEQGYRTGIIGKWHLGTAVHQHPLNNGFDYFWGFLSGSRSYFNKDDDLDSPTHSTIMQNWEHTGFKGYLTDEFGKHSVEFVGSETSKDRPFFLYLSFNAPHTPMEAKKDILQRFDGHPRQTLAAMMWSMDEAVGMLVKKLKKTGLYENTLIFFLSDNGGAHNNDSSVLPLKGWKGNQFEGGIRVPFVMTWKREIDQSGTSKRLVSSLDIYKTSALAAGVANDKLKGLDGIDLLDMHAKHQWLFWRKDQMASLRFGQFKLISLKGERSVLYDLEDSLSENIDIGMDNTLLKRKLERQLKKWEEGLIQPLWVEPKDWNLVTEGIYKDLMNNRVVKVKSPSDL
jgi:arylsulfatase A-like enzyme